MTFARKYCLILPILALNIASAATFAELKQGQRVHLAMETYEPLCDGIVSKHILDVVTVKLLKSTPECGAKGSTIVVASDSVTEISSRGSAAPGSGARKVLKGAAGVAILTATRLTPREIRPLLLMANGVVFPLLAFGAAKINPPRVDYTLVLSCADSSRCVSSLAAAAGGSETSNLPHVTPPGNLP